MHTVEVLLPTKTISKQVGFLRENNFAYRFEQSCFCMNSGSTNVCRMCHWCLTPPLEPPADLPFHHKGACCCMDSRAGWHMHSLRHKSEASCHIEGEAKDGKSSQQALN